MAEMGKPERLLVYVAVCAYTFGASVTLAVLLGSLVRWLIS